MTEQNELITVFLAFIVLAFVVTNLAGIRTAVSSRLLPAAFFAGCAAWLLTVLEGFAFHSLCNLLEHVCYLTGAVLLAAWVWKLKARNGVAGI